MNPQFKADELADSAKSKMQQSFKRGQSHQDKAGDVAKDGKAAADPKGEEQKAMLGQFGRELARFSAICAVVYFVGYMQVRIHNSRSDPEGPLCSFSLSVEFPPDHDWPCDIHYWQCAETVQATEGRVPSEGRGRGRGGGAQGGHAWRAAFVGQLPRQGQGCQDVY